MLFSFSVTRKLKLKDCTGLGNGCSRDSMYVCLLATHKCRVLKSITCVGDNLEVPLMSRSYSTCNSDDILLGSGGLSPPHVANDRIDMFRSS